MKGRPQTLQLAIQVAATLPSLIALLPPRPLPLQPASMISFQEIARRLGQTASESLTEGGSLLPSCHQSDAAFALLRDRNITVKRWDAYPDAPASFLNKQWDSEKTSPLQDALKLVSKKMPCPLDEHSCATRIIAPVSIASVDTFVNIFEVKLKDQNLQIQSQLRNESRTTADLAAWNLSKKFVYGVEKWTIDKPAVAFQELKPPKAACSNEMAKVDSLIGSQLDVKGTVTNEVKLIGQVSCVSLLLFSGYSDCRVAGFGAMPPIPAQIRLISGASAARSSCLS